MQKVLGMLLSVVAGTVMFSNAALAAEPAKQVPAPQPAKHVVAEGESLSAIATNGSLASWRPIWNANAQLSNPDSLNVGEELVVPQPTEQIADRPLPAGYGEVIAAPVQSVQNNYQSAPVASTRYRSSAVNHGTPADGLAQRVCARESGCNYATNTGNGYYGAYQFDTGTWGGYGGYARADQAPQAVQDAKFAETYARRGCSPWPNTCR